MNNISKEVFELSENRGQYLAYIHDHKFKLSVDNKFYTDGKFTNELFNRYIFSDCDEILIVARKITIYENYGKYNLIDHPQVKFSCVTGINPIQIFIRNLFINLFIFKKVLESDMIIIRLPSFLGVFCGLLSIIFNKKYFVEIVGHAKDSLLDGNSGFIKIIFANIYFKLTQFVIKKSAGAIYVTKEALQQDFPCLGISEYASNVILKIDNKFNPKKDYSILNTPNIGLIGSFNNHYKGIDFAIKTIAFLKEKRKLRVDLHILGHGKLLEEYQELAKSLNIDDQVFFDGLLPLEQVPNWLDNLDIYIQPSLTEGLPRSLIEAMSRGLPCIASNVGGIPELLKKDMIFNDFDENIFSTMIESLLSSYSDREREGSENFKNSLEYEFEVLELKRRNFWEKSRSIVMKGQ